MAKVQDNSSIQIIRKTEDRTTRLENKLFNGYVYSLSLEIGYGGEPNILTIHLALNKTLKNVGRNKDIQAARKAQLAKLSAPKLGKPSPLLSEGLDNDFMVEDEFIGFGCSYDIIIADAFGNPSYSLLNFKIVAFSINKKDNEKILTLTLHDNSIILNKIFVGILGQHIAIDNRSIQLAKVYNVQVNCPEVGDQKNIKRTLNGINVNTHAPSYNLAADIFKKQKGKVNVGHKTIKGLNFLFIETGIGLDPKKTLENGYGAVIIVGEEEFKFSECELSESTYSFNTLLGAMDTAKIIVTNLIDKSRGALKRNFSGTLKEVLNQWCSEYSYSYVVDFSHDGVLSIIGIDLSDAEFDKAVLKTKLNLEILESDLSPVKFVIKSQDFTRDLSQKNLKLYSSIYHKEAKNKTTSYESNLGNVNLECIKLPDVFEMWFGTHSTGKDLNGTIITAPKYDFSGSIRSYEQVLTSAVLGKFSSKLRQIYNYMIGAYLALGFLPATGNIRQIIKSKIPMSDDAERMFEEAISSVIEMQVYNMDVDAEGKPDLNGKPIVLYDCYLGLYNQELVNQVEKIESFIADFIGAHYWTDILRYKTGSFYSENFTSGYEVSTVPSSQKIYTDQVDTMPIFRQLATLDKSMMAIYSTYSKYFEAMKELSELRQTAKEICNNRSIEYIKFINDPSKAKEFRFYTARSDCAFAAYQELIKDIETLTYSIKLGEESTTATLQHHEINLADIFAPHFKELSPISLALLKATIPIDILSIPMESFKFGVFIGFKPDYQIFDFSEIHPSRLKRNEIELQHQIRRICQATGDAFAADELVKLTRSEKQNACNRTLLYTYCVLPYEQKIANEQAAAAMQSMTGASPESCEYVKIYRKFPILSIIKAHLIRILKEASLIVMDTPEELKNIFIHRITDASPQGESLDAFKLKSVDLTITCPSQANFATRIVSKTSSEVFLPAQQFVAGGLEKNIAMIIENEGFGVDILLNNVTPNVRESFADSAQKSTLSQTVTHVDIDTNIGYQFLSFENWHNYLSKYFNNINLSSNSAKLSYSAEIFCSSVNSELRDILSVKKGLSKLAITLGEGGLNIQCSFESRPAKAISLETLTMKNKPNIKLINNYWNS